MAKIRFGQIGVGGYAGVHVRCIGELCEAGLAELVAFAEPAIERNAERIEELTEKGVQLVDKPRMGAEGKKIVFLNPKSTHGVLIELKEK